VLPACCVFDSAGGCVGCPLGEDCSGDSDCCGVSSGMNVVNLLVKEEKFTEQTNHFHLENQRVSLTFGTHLSILKAISKRNEHITDRDFGRMPLSII
jgi:hypothetical protein